MRGLNRQMSAGENTAACNRGSGMSISERVRGILAELPRGVELVAAAKKRTAGEILEAVGAGVTTVGENYLQEALAVCPAVGSRVKWHFIGRLQRNKIRKIVEVFDLVETVDSLETVREIDRRAASAGRVMPVLVEVNIGREKQKAGVMPETLLTLLKETAPLKNIEVAGLMTMGPAAATGEELRVCFREIRVRASEINALGLPGINLRHLSMGMSDSYRVAVEEGATMVRIGSRIFGPRGED